MTNSLIVMLKRIPTPSYVELLAIPILSEQALFMESAHSQYGMPDGGINMTELQQEMVPKIYIEIARQHGSRLGAEEFEGSLVFFAGSDELAGRGCERQFVDHSWY